MEIIISETGKKYKLSMRIWDDGWDEPDVSQDVIIDSSFSWDAEAEAWRVTGGLESLIDYLDDWEQYDTEDDRAAYDEDEREQLREDHPRYYELNEING